MGKDFDHFDLKSLHESEYRFYRSSQGMDVYFRGQTPVSRQSPGNLSGLISKFVNVFSPITQ